MVNELGFEDLQHISRAPRAGFRRRQGLLHSASESITAISQSILQTRQRPNVRVSEQRGNKRRDPLRLTTQEATDCVSFKCRKWRFKSQSLTPLSMMWSDYGYKVQLQLFLHTWNHLWRLKEWPRYTCPKIWTHCVVYFPPWKLLINHQKSPKQKNAKNGWA